jgi:4-amino-4-deoxy-L-arabinose transferase-like glycosyltransferase
MMAVVWLILIAGAALGYGYLIARALQLTLVTRLERGTITIGLGAGFLVIAIFVLGLLHLIGRGSSLLLILPAAAFALWKVVTAPWEVPGAATQPRGLRLALLSALAICVVANILGTLAPPSFVDALVYHLFIPRTYARAGGIVELSWIWQSYQPLGVEMLFTLGFSLQGATLAALNHTGLGILAACATGLLGRRIAGPLGGLVAAVIFYCTAMLAWESTSSFVELGITAFSALGFYALLRWTDDENPRWLIVAAFLMGIAGTCKLTAIQFAVIACALVAWISWRRHRPFGVIAGRVATFSGVALGPCVPWYIHSYLWTGNPVYPFAAKVFGANQDYDNVWQILSHYGHGHGVLDLLLVPWLLLSSGALFDSAQYLSPLPLIFAPLIVMRLRGSRDRQVLGAAAGALFILWLSSAHIARYLVPLQPLFAVLAADAICAAAVGCRYRARLMVLTGALFVGFGTLSTLLFLKTLAPVVFGRESAEAYLTRTAAWYTVYQMVMADVPENGLIFTNQGPTYYLDRPHVRVRDAEFLAGPERLSKLLAGGPYTHILVHGQLGIEASVTALGPRVKLLWHRELEMPLSRTFGGTVKLPSALFEIVR